MEGIEGILNVGGTGLELLEEVIQIYIERKEWFGELIIQHITDVYKRQGYAYYIMYK